MRAKSDLEAAIPHIAHDMMLLRVARESWRLRIGWTTWYVMARNSAVFFEIFQGRRDDIRASEFFVRGSGELATWKEARQRRLEAGPPQLSAVYDDASQAVAHLSWKRVTQPAVQRPSLQVTSTLLGLWGDFTGTLAPYWRTRILQAWAGFHAPRP